MSGIHERARDAFAAIQDQICEELERVDGKHKFIEDRWEHRSDGSSAGGGRSRVMAGGAVFEKAGVNLADVRGTLSERLADRLKVKPQMFEATGVSLVVHPLSPRVPTVHMNVRHIQLLGEDGKGEGPAWFGGGTDLTPYYLEEQDAVDFHRVLHDVCERHSVADYPRFKQWCDEYFHLGHRGEARGIGGIFFDYLKESPERTLAFVEEVGQSFIPAYVPIVERRMQQHWWDDQRKWQLLRRGRYVEFNLVHDRGTLFGLETGGRTESILMSLPPLVRWEYDAKPAPGSPEAELLEVLLKPRGWIE